MGPAGRSFLASALLLAAILPAAAAPANAPARKATIPQLKDPMIFYLAQGEPNSCGLGCDEWIAAEGEITNGTAERMRAFLKRLGGKSNSRPIYFHSPGGVTSESMAIGRLMRERGMIARVGRSLPFDCAGSETDRTCVAAKRSGRPLVARLVIYQGGCLSACVYAIVGARLREISPEARLGIHAAKTVLLGVPKNVIISAQTRARFAAENQQAIRRYLVEMAIPTGLLDAAEKIPNSSIYFLSRDEMVRFKIDTRNAVEGSWAYEERQNDAFVIKSVEEMGTSPFRRAVLRLSCSSGEFLFGFAREIGPHEDAFVPMRLVAASQAFELPPLGRSGEGSNRYDIRGVVVPVNILETAAAEDSIEIEPGAENGKRSVRFSTLGLGSALSALSRHCDQVSSGGEALVPRQSP